MKKIPFLSGILCGVLAFSLFLTGCGQSPAEPVPENKAEEITEVAPQPSVSETTSAAEPKYAAKKGLQTVLVMGLDKFEAPETEIGYLNDQQCDFLMLLVIDEKNQVCDVLHLNRDTMTEIRKLGVGGGDAGRFTGQLALSHTYGSGGSDSCLNTKKAVSTLLKGVRIDHYLAMTMAGVAKLNDLVGGVELEVLEDMTSYDPALIQGETVTLHGEQALYYVRGRAHVADQSNLNRMERQRQYLSALYEKLMTFMQEDHSFLDRSLLEMTAYFQSDLTVNQLSALGEVLENCRLNPFTTIDGEAVKGEEFMEFYVDEDSLNQVLIRLFCE